MRICFINILFSRPWESGGLGTHIASLSLVLAASGHEVTVVTSGSGSPYNRNGVKIVPIAEVDRYTNPLQIFNPVFVFRRLVYIVKMTRYVLASRFDIVEVADGGLEQLLLALHRNCVLVTKLHGNFRLIYRHGGLLSAFIERLEAWVVRRSDHIYASTTQYSKVISEAYGIPREMISIIPCGIDVSLIRSFQRRDLTVDHPQIAGKKVVLLSVGTSPRRKGADVFLEAVKLIRSANLLPVLLCDDPEFLKSVQVPANVLVLSRLTQPEFYNWICVSEIVVFASSAETFSIALHEAMFFGKRLVISPLIPLEGIDLEYPHSVVLSKLDAHSLAAAIDSIAGGHQVFAEFTNELVQRFHDYYDIGHVARKTENLYRKMCEGKKAS